MPQRDLQVQKRVSACYASWGNSYFQEYYQSGKSYPPVHFNIVKKALSVSGARTILDVGCGPASMLRGLQGFGKNRYGFDLTPNMVSEAQRVLARQGVPTRNIWEGSVLDASAYRPPAATRRRSFESAICFGVLPHIPENHDQKVFGCLRKSVVRGGIVLVEARNELFALFSCNRYTYDFFAERLIRPKTWKGLPSSRRKYFFGLVTGLRKHFRMDLPPIRRGKAGEPGYDEVLSRTHNPFVAAQQFAKAGFKEVDVLFYHYHCLPPMFERLAPDFFRRQSLKMENPRDWRGHFMASAFILKGIAD